MDTDKAFTQFLLNLNTNLMKSLELFASHTLSQSTNNKEQLQPLLKSINSKLNEYIECLAPYMEDIEYERLKDSMNKLILIHKDKLSIKSSALYKNIQKINEKDISPNSIDIPIIHNLNEMTPMFYWYDGDPYHKQGVYTCIVDGFYIKVPFPSTVSTSDNRNSKINSIPCKNTTKEACLKNKKYISEIHKTNIHDCSYVHKKERFEKIGSIYKCSIESFGNHNTLRRDLNCIELSDIKRLLMYSLSDSLLVAIWYQNNCNNGELVISNLDIY
jgi:hypothetical protein